MALLNDYSPDLEQVLDQYPFLVPMILVLSGLILGLLFEFLRKKIKDTIIIKKIKNNWKKEGTQASFKLKGVKIVLSSLKGFFILWFLLVGVYAAISLSFQKENLDTITAILFIIFMITLIWAVINIFNGVIRLQSKALASTSIFMALVRLTIVLFGLLIIFVYFKIEVTPVLTALGIAGFAVALALQDTLSNFFAGLYLIASRQIKLGNYIKLDSGEEGIVIDINWRSTTIQALAHHIIIVPNSKVTSATIINYDLPQPPISVPIPVGVSYTSDLDKVERVTKEVAIELLQDPNFGGVPDWEPLIRFHTFSDFSINFNVILRVTQYTEQFCFRTEFIKRLHKRYKQEGIVIPFPIRTIHLQDDKDQNEIINRLKEK